MPASITDRVQFGVFELDLQRAELRKQGVKVKLQDQPLKVLQVLLENPGQIVSREELRQRIWPANTFVEFDQGLYSAMARLRDALGDSSDSPRFIETVARKGYRFIAPIVELPEPPARQKSQEASVDPAAIYSGRFRSWVGSVVAGLLGGALLVALALTFNVAGTREWLRTRTSTIRSIAVLPLENLSGDPNQEYFADGMTDELITELAQVENLRVISRTSAMHYKNTKKTLPDIARELSVDAVLEGSVARAGDRVRITAQLIQADGDRHLWAQSYERNLRDILALQSDVAQGIVGQVRAELRPREAVPSVNPEAYEAYLRGRHDLNNATSEAELESSISNFEVAITKDSQSALGYSGLAVAYASLADFYRPPTEVMPLAKRAAERALQLNPNLSEAHDALGWVELNYDWNWPSAEQHLKRAIELSPGNASAHDHYAWFLGVFKRRQESLDQNRIAQRLDPLALNVLTDSSFYAYMARDYDLAISEGKRGLQLDPKCNLCRTQIGMADVQKGDFKDALAQIAPVKFPSASPLDVATTLSLLALAGERQRALELQKSLVREMKQRYICPYEMATGYTALGDREQALHWLQTAYQEHSICVIWIENEPRFDPLRSDPRFTAIIRDVGLPQ